MAAWALRSSPIMNQDFFTTLELFTRIIAEIVIIFWAGSWAFHSRRTP